MDQASSNLGRKVCPQDRVNFVSRMFFIWLHPLFWKGWRRTLEIDDLYRVPRDDESRRLGDRLLASWDEEQNKCKKPPDWTEGGFYDEKKKKEPSLLRAIVRTFGPLYMAIGVFAFIEEAILRVLQPIFMGLLVRYYSNTLHQYSWIPDPEDKKWAWIFGSGIVICSILYCFTHHAFFFGVQRVGMRVRVACCSVIYRKALRLSQASLGTTTIGQMVNLLSNDVNRFDQSFIMLHYLWVGPLQTAIATAVLYYELGPSCFAGILLLILFVPFQGYMGKVFSRLRLRTAKKTDERVRLMSEILDAMRVIKMYAWESRFAQLVDRARREEIKIVNRISNFRGINMGLFYSSSKLILLVTFVVYIALGNELTAERVFLSVALYNNIRLVMTFFFPFGITQAAESLISVQRLQDFLMLEEQKVPGVIKPGLTSDLGKPSSGPVSSIQPELRVNNITAQWSAESSHPTITDLSFNVKAGQLVAVVGPVGCGKTSLLQAILGELPLTRGSIKAEGKLGYTGQEPWVFAGTIRQNVLFGKDFDNQRYNRVLSVCALSKDLELFPYGDRTLVGDRGITLSGGQKARLSLARALYQDADIYLLDDPLSAVDAHVGRHLFDKCIMGYLSKKPRILVTHQLQFLRKADLIIVLKEGKAEISGTYQELEKSGLDVLKLIAEHQEDQTAKKRVKRERTYSTGSVTSMDSLVSHSGLEEGGHQVQEKTEEDVTENTAGGDAPAVQEEMRSKGSIGLKTYGKYLGAGGNFFTLSIFAVSTILSQVLFSGSDWWLARWTDARQEQETMLMTTTLPSTTMMPDDLLSTNDTFVFEEDTEIFRDSFLPTADKMSDLDHLYVYIGIVVLLVIVAQVRSIQFFLICMKASVVLHAKMFQSVLRAPIKFFDDNPVGRVLNRFSRDTGNMDELLPVIAMDVVMIFLLVLGNVAMIAVVNTWILVPTSVCFAFFSFLRSYYLKTARDVKRLEGVSEYLCMRFPTGVQTLGVITIVATVNVWLVLSSVGLILIFYKVRQFYMATARDVKRLESLSRSPVFSHLSASLNGLPTIRCFKAQGNFTADFDSHQDLHSSSWFLFIACTRWFGVILDWIIVLYLAIVVYSFMLLDSSSLGGEVGLAISSAMMLTGMFQWGVRQSAELENQMTSVERVMEYSKLEPEAALKSPEGTEPPPSWPEEGKVEFKDMSLQYIPDDPPVLKNLTFVIEAREKIGICGRTGAGKSSMIAALFRLTEPTGQILIDSVDTKKIGLHELRKQVSIIPQDPVLFQGSMRKNLDPFAQYSDREIWEALEEVQLKEAIQKLAGGLETQLTEGGANFSVGQRQLVCLARAILRKNKILVMDEATANVDPKTDNLIQKTIRCKFSDCTVLTIAHRLDTIIDSDKVLVLAAGQILEYGHPHELLKDKKGAFFGLVEQTGAAQGRKLTLAAAKAYSRKHPELGLFPESASEEEAVVDDEEEESTASE